MRHARLVEEDRALGVDPGGEQRRRHLARVASELGGVVIDGDRVEVREEEQALAHLLHRHPVADRAQIIAEMEVARRLDPGDDSHH